MNWIVKPSVPSDNTLTGIPCAWPFAVIGGCLVTILCSNLCIVKCYLDTRPDS